MRDRKPILRPNYGGTHASAVRATMIRPRPEPEVIAATPSLPECLEALAARVRHLSPSHRDPNYFFEERDEIDGALVRLARDYRTFPLA